MRSFTQYLTEGLEVQKLKHLEHLEDAIFEAGSKGFRHVVKVLHSVDRLMLGEPQRGTIVGNKYDGAPSLVWGHDPETGKFFVASKSAFNKNPKINYTEEDIEDNHGHAPGLVEKMKAALKYLPSVTPKKGVFQGDVMYGEEDKKIENGRVTFTPNRLTYSVKADSPEGQRAASAKFGIVVHTRYEGDSLADMTPKFDVDVSKFKKSAEVHVIDPIFKPLEGKKSPYDKKLQGAFRQPLEHAIDEFRTVEDHLDELTPHATLIKTYVNNGVRLNEPLSVNSFMQFIETKKLAAVSTVKSPDAQERKAAPFDELLRYVDKNRDVMASVFRIHDNIQRSKAPLLDAMQKSAAFDTSIDGVTSKGEGQVVTIDGIPIKLVDRSEFSRQNFLGGRFKKGDEGGAPETDPNEPKKPIVMSFGRMNPITSGHEKLVAAVTAEANKRGVDHLIALSNSQDPFKNPLSSDRKVVYAKKFFPNANIAASSSPSMMSEVKAVWNKGYDHLVMMVGEDRKEEFQQLLNRYNGPGKEFNFKKIEVVSVGKRDEKAQGVEGMSASKLRELAGNDDFEGFRRGLPSTATDDVAKMMYREVRAGMDYKITPKTSNVSLGMLARRRDALGRQAEQELMRRQKLAEMRKK